MFLEAQKIQTTSKKQVKIGNCGSVLSTRGQRKNWVSSGSSPSLSSLGVRDKDQCAWEYGTIVNGFLNFPVRKRRRAGQIYSVSYTYKASYLHRYNDE